MNHKVTITCDIAGVKPPLGKLEVMWFRQAVLMALLDLKEDDSTMMEAITGLVEEAGEALHVWRSNLRKWKEVKPEAEEELVEELADVLHYVLEIAILLGMAPESLFQAYIDKWEANIKRLAK